MACRAALSWCAGDNAAEEVELFIWDVAQILLMWDGGRARVDIGGSLGRMGDGSVVVAHVPAGVHCREKDIERGRPLRGHSGAFESIAAVCARSSIMPGVMGFPGAVEQGFFLF